MPEVTLAEFLLARIAQDERAAVKLTATDARPAFSLATTINHPARLLEECKAKRRIVEPWPLAGDEDDWRYGVHAAAREVVLRNLAVVYADHPDYREEWRP